MTTKTYIIMTIIIATVLITLSSIYTQTSEDEIIGNMLLRELRTPQIIFLLIGFIVFFLISLYGDRNGAFPLLMIVTFFISFIACDYDYALGREVTHIGPLSLAVIILGFVLSVAVIVFAWGSQHKGWWNIIIVFSALFITFIATETPHLRIDLPIKSNILYVFGCLLLVVSVGIAHRYSILKEKPKDDTVDVETATDVYKLKHEKKYKITTMCPYCGHLGNTIISKSIILDARGLMLKCTQCNKYFSVKVGGE